MTRVGASVSQIVLRLSPLPTAPDTARSPEVGEPEVEVAPDEIDSVAGPEATEPVSPADAAAGIPPNGHGAAATAADPRLTGPTAPLARWSATVAAAHDACVLLDPEGHVVSLSVPGATVLGCADAGVIGRPLLDVIKLVDFEAGDSHPDYAQRIPPLAALRFVTLVRGLLRVRQPDDRLITIDAVAAPLHDAAGSVIGSIAFLSPVTPG